MPTSEEGSEDGRMGRERTLKWAITERRPERFPLDSFRTDPNGEHVENSQLAEWNQPYVAPPPPVASDRELLSSIKNARRRRDIISEKRVVVLNQRTNYRHQRDAVHKARNKFLLAAKNLRVYLAQQSIDTSKSSEYQQFESSFLELGKFNQTLDDVELILQKADKDLGVRENKLSIDEKKIYRALSRYVASPPHSTVRPPKPRSRRSSSNSSTEDPSATEYYKMAGTVKILRERLHNKQVQYLQDVSSRQNDMELGRSLQPSEKDFRRNYFVDLSALYAELVAAKKEASQLKQTCGEKNIPLEEYADSQNEAEALHLTLDLDRQLIHHAATLEDAEERIALLSDFLSGYMDPKTKVEDWLVDLPLRDKTVSIELPDTLHCEDDPISVDYEEAATSSRIHLNSSMHITSMVPAISSDQGRADGEAKALSVGSSKKSWPTSHHSYHFDFTGEAPARRYSDGMLERPLPVGLEEEIYNSRMGQKRPSSASGIPGQSEGKQRAPKET